MTFSLLLLRTCRTNENKRQFCAKKQLLVFCTKNKLCGALNWTKKERTKRGDIFSLAFVENQWLRLFLLDTYNNNHHHHCCCWCCWCLLSIKPSNHSSLGGQKCTFLWKKKWQKCCSSKFCLYLESGNWWENILKWLKCETPFLIATLFDLICKSLLLKAHDTIGAFSSIFKPFLCLESIELDGINFMYSVIDICSTSSINKWFNCLLFTFQSVII